MAAAAPLAPTPQSVIAAQMAYGPNAGAAFQRSQYLAEALRNLQSDGAQNIRTPTALLANLLADGVMEWSKSRADKQAMAAYQADAADQGHKLFDHTPGDPTYQQPASQTPPAATGVSLADAVAGPAQPPPPPPPPPPEDAAPKTPATGKVTNAPLLARTILGEAAGEGDTGMNAVGHVILNRLNKGYGHATTLDQVIEAPHQFPGLHNRVAQMSETDPRFQHALALAQAVEGTPDPTNGATLYLNPELQAQQGHAQPSWATGPSQRIGHHVFYGGDPQMAQAGPSPGPQIGPQPPMAAPQTQPAPQMVAGPGPEAAPGPQGQPPAVPYQIASNGPTPPPPGVGPQVAASAPPPPMAAGPQAPVASAGQPAPAAAPLPAAGAPNPNGGVPHQLVTPQEWQYARQLYNDPRTRQEGIALAQHLHMREAAPLEAPKNMMWNEAAGRFVPMPGTETTQLPGGTPSDAAQRDAFGAITHSAIPGKQGAVPEGKMFDPVSGSYVAIAGGQPRQLVTPEERAAAGIRPYDRGGYAIGADGKLIAGAPDPFGPEKQLSYTSQIQGMEPYKDYTQSRGFLSTMKNLMQQPGGFADLGLIENAGKTINPTIAIRPNMIEQYGKEVGFPQWIQGEISSIQNNGGHLTAQARNALLNIAQANVQSHWDQLQPILKKVDHDAEKYGVKREDLLPDLVPMEATPPPAYPHSAVPGTPQPGVPQPNGHVAADPDPIIQTRAGPMRRSQIEAIAKGSHR